MTGLRLFSVLFSPVCAVYLTLQGVPKVRSSNVMRYSFRSKLYFYMQFLEDVYGSIEYLHSEFQ